MATEGCIPVQFFSAIETAIYFEDAEIDLGLDEDTFCKSPKPETQKWVRSKDSKFLILNTEEKQFQVRNLTSEQQECRPECKFNFQMYKDSSSRNERGLAVILYVIKDGEKMVVCCNDKHEIIPEKMELPHNIMEKGHKAIFYKQFDNSPSRYLFESSLYPSEFLGFKCDKNNPTLSRLVLRHKGKDQVDESVQVFLC